MRRPPAQGSAGRPPAERAKYRETAGARWASSDRPRRGCHTGSAAGSHLQYSSRSGCHLQRVPPVADRTHDSAAGDDDPAHAGSSAPPSRRRDGRSLQRVGDWPLQYAATVERRLHERCASSPEPGTRRLGRLMRYGVATRLPIDPRDHMEGPERRRRTSRPDASTSPNSAIEVRSRTRRKLVFSACDRSAWRRRVN